MNGLSRQIQVPVRRLLDVLEDLLDDRVGIIRHVEEIRREPGAPAFFHYLAQACDARPLGGYQNYASGGGAASERTSALGKAVGEAIERYCSAFYRLDELPFSPYASASFDCIPPESFALYEQTQYQDPEFPYVPFTESTPIHWTPSVDLATGAPVHVPAAMVFMPYHFDTAAGEPPFCQRISTGLACHCSFEEAAVGGICEVIERDAFTITWQARLARPIILRKSLPAPLADLADRIEATGTKLTLLFLEMDHGVPTVLSIASNTEPDGPALIFAAASSLNPVIAARKSMEEIAHTWRLAYHLKGSPPLVSGPGCGGITSQDDHVHFFCAHENAHLANFIVSRGDPVPFDALSDLSTGDARSDLEVLKSRIASLGARILLADLTTDDVRNLGLRVVRAIIPGFHPLFIGHRLRALGGERLWTIPQRLGYGGITCATGDNPAPHPYP
ncbi:YcaO domain-containing protein [Nitrospira tepida]|uniref:YcaO domain-containing protein n=1 Tax=Nitrospira tepida TaxID=2973512 RepID=A0AA86MWN3_9BACT|nr:YcaO-like family protein [Nitrospira tepida]CAI4030431.1 YcaO domain-containing protein [Nitrospira tepida]